MVKFSQNRFNPSLTVESKFGDSDKARGSKSLQDLDEALGLEFCIEVVIARIDSNGLKPNEF